MHVCSARVHDVYARLQMIVCLYELNARIHVQCVCSEGLSVCIQILGYMHLCLCVHVHAYYRIRVQKCLSVYECENCKYIKICKNTRMRAYTRA
jgi:hypothetical protein